MMAEKRAASIQQRLVFQHLVLGALVSACLFFAIRIVAFQTAEATQDNLLRAATNAISQQISSSEEQVIVNLPHIAFALLETSSQDRVFYNILLNGVSITGYDDFLPEEGLDQASDQWSFSTNYKGFELRAAVLSTAAPASGHPQSVTIILGQTRYAQQEVADRFARWALFISGLIYLGLVVLGIGAARSAVWPLHRVAQAVARRGPNDLRPVEKPTPVELAPLMSSLNEFIRRLRQTLQRTETFIAEAAHHIRTPLATVMTETEIALRNTTSDDTRAALRKVIVSIEESARSANQLLAYATVSQRSDSIDLEVVDLREKVREAFDALSPTADLKDIDMSISESGECFDIHGDMLMIEISLKNLIDNAIKYSDPDTEISIHVTGAMECVEVVIKDQGRGLGGADPKKLMVRFQRGPNSGGVIGTGIGLAIVYEVARSHGGQFELKNNEEGGICATLSFPCLH